jgi:hypothetical protein
MKKLMVGTFAVAVMMSLMAIAQDTTKQDSTKQDSVASAKLSKNALTISGKVSEDGKTFVSDKDSKSWTVSNPDLLKGHEGHQVTVTANVDADKNEVTILTVKMIKTDTMK